MASKAAGAASESLKYKTWVLKVSIYCQGCKRKVKKVLQKIDGVYTTTVDLQQQRVVVTGNVEVETLIKKLVKAGKHAEIWEEKLKGKENKFSGKMKNKEEERKPESSQICRGRNDNAFNKWEQKVHPASNKTGSEKRQGKTKNEMGQTREGKWQYAYPYPQEYFPSTMLYIPSSPYAWQHQAVYSPCLIGPFEIFSDENANGCFVM